MIVELINKHKNVAFITSSIKKLMQLCVDEGIVFSKGGFKEDIFIPYHLKSNIAIINHNDESKEYEFYSRDIKDWNMYKDWNEHEIINYDKIIRNNKLKNILE